MTLPPIRRSVSVSWAQDAAFRRFTTDFGAWWPSRSHSIGGERVRRVVFEPRVGGRIFEEHGDGRRFQWGEIRLGEPPRRVEFTWHPAREPATAQDVLIEFVPEGSGTRVELTAGGWERWGENVSRAYRGYNVGWAYILNVWAGRRTARMALLDVIVAIIGFVQRFRGGVDGEIARARGELPRA
jgi:uncharacterized protein YndB with AHSA1/START domain